LPIAGTFPALRLLLVPGIGALAAIAAILAHAWDTRRRVRPWLAGAGALALVHGVAGPLLVPPALVGWSTFVDRHNAAFAGAELDDAIVAEQSVVVLRAPDVITGLYAPIQRAAECRPMPYAWWLVSAAPCGHEVTRTGPRELQVALHGCAMLRGDLPRLVRSRDAPLAAGDEVRLEGMTVAVIDCEAGEPTRIALRFDTEPDDPRYAFLAWRDGGFRRIEAPAEGAALRLAGGALDF
ncbi:MAG: hypothetical protein FJ087_20100, partial [Deltaproteobacteria bacterium]|nr:hypothetical protein [Deltaproteobacteria bacterium]